MLKFKTNSTMIKLKLILSSIIAFAFFSNAQAQLECAYDVKTNYLDSADSTYLSAYKKQKISNSINAGSFQAIQYAPYIAPSGTQNLNSNYSNSGAFFYVIPVVFHVIHDVNDANPGTNTNVSNEQIYNQLDTLNKYFNPYHIKFCLAKYGPDSMPITGISRRADNLCEYRIGVDNDELMNLDALPYDKYLNIWIVKKILFDDGTPSNYLGSAAYVKYQKMGVVVRYDFLGKYNSSCSTCNINTNSRGKTLVHEIGHIFGLEHVYLGGCQGDSATNCLLKGDYICDTPPMNQGNSSCSSILNTCPDHLNGNDPINNYMAYKQEDCLFEFTAGQLAVMYYNIETYFAGHIDVDNLNLVTRNQCNVKTALFKTDKYVLCDQEEVEFTVFSTGLSYIWKIYNTTTNTGYTSQSITDSFYRYNFTVPGEYDITLCVVLSNGDTIKRKLKKLITLIDCGNKISSKRGNWYFGMYGGLEFREFATIPNSSSYFAKPNGTIFTYEGCIVQNDLRNNLLFYGGGKVGYGSDGLYIFNRNHKMVPHARLMGSFTSAQGGVVIPMPGDTNRYYIFITNNDNRSSDYFKDFGLRYSIFNKSLDGTNGDIDTNYWNKRILPPNGRFRNLDSDSTIRTGEGIAATPGCDDTHYYFIVTSMGSKDSARMSKSIEVYKVDANGITHHKQYWHTEVFNSNGAIVFSNDGRMVSVCGLLFEFDRQTGSIKFIVNLQSQQPSNVEKTLCHSKFSNDNKIFYLVNHIDLGNGNYRKELKQYDLKNGAWQPYTSILKDNAYSLQLGPDKKMYISQLNDNYISVIESPDTLNNFQDPNVINISTDKINLRIGPADMRSMGGFPNFVDAGKENEITPKIYHRVTNCNNYYFYTNQCCKTNYTWYFGDGTSSSGPTATHQYNGKLGTYNVELVIDNSIHIYETIKFGIEGFGISGMQTVCDTSIPAQYSVKKPINTLGKYDYYYDWTVNGGNKEVEALYGRYVNVKWTSATGDVKLKVTNTYGCKDTSILNYTLDNTVISNTLVRLFNCERQFIKGSVPNTGNGNYAFSWLSSEDGINYTTINGEKSMHFYPTINNKPMYYKRTVFTGGCYFESKALKLMPYNFENVVYTSKSGNDTCTEYIEGSNITQYFSGGTYLWEYSTDQNNWISTNIGTRAIRYPIDSIKKYFRRKVITDSCTTYSNIVSVQGVKFDKALVQESKCGSNIFPIGLSFQFYNPTNVALSKKLQLKKADSIDWVTLQLDINSDEFYNIASAQNKKLNFNDLITIENNDSLRLFCAYNCTKIYNLYSNAIGINNEILPEILQQPISKKISGGDVGIFRVKVRDSSRVSYQWQSSENISGPWSDINNSDSSRLGISSGNCYKDTFYYRVVIYHPCDTNTSNVVSLIIDPVTNSNSDYYSKDTEEDVGKEPNPDTEKYAVSKDIWVRYKRDGIKKHQDIDPGLDTNYVYVQIRNRGNNPIKSGKLYTYWTWGATQESWPINWTENSENEYERPNRISKFYMGGEINKIGIVIPEIPKYGEYLAVIPWTSFPKKGWYNLNEQRWKNDRVNVCLLSRIETCDIAPYGMKVPEITDVRYNIIQNNNIISRNTYDVSLFNPVKGSEMDGHQSERMALNPNIQNGGVILVRNNSNESQAFNICFNTNSSDYFLKAEMYFELSNDLQLKVQNSDEKELSNIAPVYGNVYKVSSSNACLENIVLPSDYLGYLEPFYAYKDINNRFDNFDKFSVKISQEDTNGYELGACYYTLSDNVYYGSEYEYIEKDTMLKVCNNGYSSGFAAIEFNDTLNFIIKDSTGAIVSPVSFNNYELYPGEYIKVSDDSLNSIRYITNLHIESIEEDTVRSIDTIQFYCEALPFGYQIFSDSAILKDKDNYVVDTVSFKFYQLDPIDNHYQLEYRNFQSCQYQITELELDDYPMALPSTPSATLLADYDLSIDTCAFVKLNDLNCEGDTVKIGQEFKVYTMDLQYRFTAQVEQYAEFTKGFKFCMPFWDTSESHINDWQALIYKTALCEYCRIDFKADTINVFNKTSNKTVIDIKTISIFPNPTTGEITLKLSKELLQESEGIIKITDNFGHIFLNTIYKEDKGEIVLNISGLSEGIYFISLPLLNYHSKIVLINK